MAEPTQNPYGLRDYNAVLAERRAAQIEEQARRSVFERVKESFRSWFTGESQIGEQAEKPATHSAPQAKQQPNELRRYEDVLAGRHDGPKYQYGDSKDAQSQSTPASQLKPYQPSR